MTRTNSSQHEELIKMSLENKSLQSSNLGLKDFISKHNLEACYSNKGIIKLHDDTSGTIRDLLSPYFTDTQITFFINQEPVRKWTSDDIAHALSFRATSPKGYSYARKHLKLPYPSPTTLHRWTKGHIFQQGLLHIILTLMKNRSEKMTKAERACIVSFDEMKVTQAWEFRRSDETVLSPKNYVQVVMVRGIIGRWKQIVYYNFDTKMTDALLKTIINAVEEVGFEVHATVCDLGGSNYSLLSKLGISDKQNTFPNPYDEERKIHVFADVPHLIKLARNHFIDHGFQNIDSEKVISTDPVKNLIMVDNGNLKLAPKLNENLLRVKGYQRQRVKLAVHLLSGTVSNALKFLGEQGKINSDQWPETSEFIHILNGWFDIFNSSVKKDVSGKRMAFQKTDEQMKVLSDTVSLVKSLRVSGRCLPFQKGILISTRSLETLYDALQERFGVIYLLTRRLNQDILEHFFSVMRQMGRCYDHPTPLSFQHRLKIYIMGRDTSVLSTSTNTEESESTPKITTRIDEISGYETDKTDNVEPPEEHPSLTCNVFTPDLGVMDEEPEIHDEVLELPFPEREATDHFLGFVVHKFQLKYPALGTLLTDSNTDNTSWDSFINRGGLKVMKPDYRSSFLKLEHHFRHCHGTSLQEGSRAVERVLQTASLPTFVPHEVAQYYVRCRVYFRIRQLNRNIIESKNTKSCKKMKKITQ